MFNKNLIIILIIQLSLDSKKFDFCNITCKKKLNSNVNFIKFKVKNFDFEAVVVNKQEICFQNCMKHYSKNLQSTSFPKELKDICINKKNVKDLSNKEYLSEFAKGTCNPTVLLPGIFGSRLDIEISDCYKFKENYSDLYNICQLDKCTDTKPWKIYNLWMTDIMSPLSIFSYREKYTKCFANFMKVIYEFDKKGNYKILMKEGLKVKVQYFNEENGKDSDCGVKAVEDYAPVNFLKKESHGFKKITELLIFMGYKNGLTFQYLPYDFRLSFNDNDLNVLFKENIQRINKLTKKKIILIAHSLGGLNALNQIKKNENVKINELIGNFVILASPFFGAIKSVFALLNLFSDFYYHGFGISRQENQIISDSVISISQMIPPNPQLIKNKDWFKWVINRISHEMINDKDSYNKEGANLLPSSDEICYNINPITHNQCIYNIQAIFKPVLVDNFKNKKYRLSDLEEITKDFFVSEQAKNLFNISRKTLIYDYNPKIQQTFIFINSIETLSQITYNRDISKEIKSNNYLEPDNKLTINGDETVPSFSILLKVYKDSFEFAKKKSYGFKPVKVLELCSIYNRLSYKDNIYDDNNGKHNIFTKNSYNGIACDCDNSSTKDECAHSKFIQDSKLLEVLSNLLQFKEKININTYDNYLKNISNEELKKYTENCEQLRFIGHGFN